MSSNADSNEDTYDAVIIGSGQGGNPLALALAAAGWKTAIVEREHVGGTCINVGCTPTKTMVASARVAHLARRGATYGVRTGPVTVDIETVVRRKREIVESFRGGNKGRIEAAEGLDLIEGHARFTGRDSIEVELSTGGRRTLRAGKTIIDAGTRPAVPPIEGLDTIPILDNASIMELDRMPEHLLVIGGGVIGLEFGQMFHRFGSRVTVVEGGERLLPNEDPDIAEALTGILREDGLDLRIGARVHRAARAADGALTLEIETTAGPETLSGSHVLVATGRRPNSDTLNVEAAGIALDPRGFIPVDSGLQTNVENIWAIGDINGGPQFTHVSYDDFRILRTNLLDGGYASTEGRLVPYTVFTDPQLGRIGVNEMQAAKLGSPVHVAKIPMSYVARALEMDESRGLIKAVVESKTKRILGVSVLGIEGGELMAVFQAAMMGNLPYFKLRDAVFAHPTLAESLNTLFASIED